MRRTNFHKVKNVSEFKYIFPKRKYYFFPSTWPEKSTACEKPALDSWLKILRKKICEGVAGLNCRSATLPKAELFHRYFTGSFDRKCRAKSLEVMEQLFCRTLIYVGHLSVNVTTLWKVSIKISNKKNDDAISTC